MTRKSASTPSAKPDRFLRNDEPGSAELAELLRAGPIRSTLDKLMRVIAEAIGVDYMVLGLRHHDEYEFIATFGVPLTGYSDHVPANRLAAKLFDREVEVPDLQKEPNFVVLDVVSEAHKWRYGVNAPVRLIRPLADGGVLALSGASRRLIRTGGPAVQQLRRFADIVADLVWLTMQIRSASTHSRSIEVVASVLMSSIRNSPFPVAIVDQNLCVVGFSPRFIDDQKRETGTTPVPGTSIVDGWLDESALAAVRASMETGKPVIAFPTHPPGRSEALRFDFHRLVYNDVPSPFGLIGFHREAESDEFILGAKSVGYALPLRSSLAEGPAISGSAAELGPVSRFLLDTLPRKQRLLKTGSRHFVGIRSWRKAIKQHQIAALRALKSDPPDAFVETVAGEMMTAIRSTYGRLDNCTVVPVPCGHSGPGCLSCRLARRVSDMLALPYCDAFIFQPVSGSSHPKANAKRPAMKRQGPQITGPVILVDDVATSGAHIKDAAAKLTEAAAVWPVVWIAD